MGRLVWKHDHSVGIRGTDERIPGTALISGATRLPDGTLELEYAGETDVDWDGQETVIRDGQMMFWTDGGDLVSESEVEVID